GTVPAARLGTFTNTELLYWSSGLAQSANLAFDSTNGVLNLGGGTTAAGQRLLVTGGTADFTGQVELKNGAVGAPSLAFAQDLTSGWYATTNGGYNDTAWSSGGTFAVEIGRTSTNGSLVRLNGAIAPATVAFTGSGAPSGGTSISSDTNSNLYLFGNGAQIVAGMASGAAGALATTATGPFLGMAATAGVPTGTPAHIPSGAVLFEPDSTDDRLYAYNSSWKPYGQFTGGLASGPLCNTVTTGLWSACTSASLTTLIGALSGDLGGTLPSPTVTAIHSGSAQHQISAFLVNGNTLALDGSGNVVTVSSAPSYALNWAMNASGLSMADDRSTLYFPGMASAQLATETASAGTSVTTTMASNWSSGASSPTFPLRAQYNQAQLTVDVPLVAASGSGSAATIRFALYQVVTSPGTGANYTEICHTDLGGITAGPTSSFQTLGCTGAVSSTLASVFLV